MKLSILVLVAAMLLPATARAEEPPMRSVPLVAVGGTLTGLGVANLATAPLCMSGGIRQSGHMPCLAMSLAFGGGLIAAGVPMIVVGAQRRPALEVPVMVQPVVGGAAVVWSAKW